MKDFTKIQAWKLADDLTVAVYAGSKSFPREELYGLTSQLRRASYSVPANIAEGASRERKKDYLHFLYISRGSLNETQYFVHLSRRLDYLTPEQTEQLQTQVDEVHACLHGLIKVVEQEAGVISRTAAKFTSLIVVCLGNFLVRSP